MCPYPRLERTKKDKPMYCDFYFFGRSCDMYCDL